MTIIYFLVSIYDNIIRNFIDGYVFYLTLLQLLCVMHNQWLDK